MPSSFPYLYFPYDVIHNVAIPIARICVVTPLNKIEKHMASSEGFIVNLDSPAEHVYYFHISVEGRKDPVRITQPYDSEKIMTDEDLYDMVNTERKRLLVILNADCHVSEGNDG